MTGRCAAEDAARTQMAFLEAPAGVGNLVYPPTSGYYDAVQKQVSARSSAGQSGGFLNRRSEVRVLSGAVHPPVTWTRSASVR